jgi:regulatory protein
MLSGKPISVSDAVIKARTFCNYRERCHKELRDKLYSMGLWKRDVDHVIMQMMDENLLNEERYAKSYARGHFYNKKWGKYKITVEMRGKQINDRLIKTALNEIDEEDYSSMIKTLIEKKAKELKGNAFEKKQKVSRYLLQKGYAYNEINPHLNLHFSSK